MGSQGVVGERLLSLGNVRAGLFPFLELLLIGLAARDDPPLARGDGRVGEEEAGKTTGAPEEEPGVLVMTVERGSIWEVVANGADLAGPQVADAHLEGGPAARIAAHHKSDTKHQNGTGEKVRNNNNKKEEEKKERKKEKNKTLLGEGVGSDFR